eukprot:TRINITY_DN7026_c0_g1_i1.p1 TRINITY_DN7026_c0_g1~~TRINITY_DN7026_c0_g1_i1.p1  ORF type:complete len:202 (+),score=52.34 TRINITY_DN7026_c0_g1_i1:840-1445(+)
MCTPNGRFNVNTKICLSMSDFHPESWNPMWTVSSILTGLLSFMLENKQTHGSISTTDEQKKQLARYSLTYNFEKNSFFRKIFPELLDPKVMEVTRLAALDTQKKPIVKGKQIDTNTNANAKTNINPNFNLNANVNTDTNQNSTSNLLDNNQSKNDGHVQKDPTTIVTPTVANNKKKKESGNSFKIFVIFFLLFLAILNQLL